jgi:probable F420-dependent oxidoreductase
MARTFRFAVQVHKLAGADWVERVRRIEQLGYSTVFLPDHFGDQSDPTTASAAIAAVTDRLNVGALVYDVDYRHPVVYAKAAATLQILSHGRHEFGIGAGWMQTDYDQSGIRYDSPGTRISRLEEAVQIIRSMWEQDSTTFEGKHYTVRGIAKAADLPAGARPRILIGGGGKRLLGVAGRYADIVGINPSLHDGRIRRDTARDVAAPRVREKIGWVRAAAQAAGRDPESIELNTLVFVTAITDDPAGIRAGISQNTGMSVEEVAECPLFITGSPAEIRDRLEKRREETGISYIVIQGGRDDLLESFARHVVEPLAGR